DVDCSKSLPRTAEDVAVAALVNHEQLVLKLLRAASATSDRNERCQIFFVDELLACELRSKLATLSERHLCSRLGIIGFDVFTGAICGGLSGEGANGIGRGPAAAADNCGSRFGEPLCEVGSIPAEAWNRAQWLRCHIAQAFNHSRDHVGTAGTVHPDRIDRKG